VTTSAWDIGGVVGGVVTVSGGIWGGIRWLIGRNDRREAKLDEKEAALIKKLEERIQLLEDRDAQREVEHDACQRRVDKLLFFCVLMVEEGEAITPASATIVRAKRYLMREFPEAFGPQPPVPEDMVKTLRQID
jgi:hypothetical protein